MGRGERIRDFAVPLDTIQVVSASQCVDDTVPK